MDEATTSWPKAPGVVNAVADAMYAPPRGRALGEMGAPRILSECRRRLAMLFGVSDPATIILTTSASHALSLALSGLDLHEGDRVVITRAEHEAVFQPLFHLRKERRIHLRIVGLDAEGGIDLDDFADALKQQTRLVVLTHASNVTGRMVAVRDLFLAAKASGAVTLLDASQTIGTLPVWANEFHADLIAVPGHKALRGPVGTGALYSAPHTGIASRFMCGADVLGELPVQTHAALPPLEPGVINIPAWAGMLTALRWRETPEAAACSERCATLTAILRDGLAQIPGVTLVGCRSNAPDVGIISLRFIGCDIESPATYLLKKHWIACRAGLHRAPLIHKDLGAWPEGTVRLSVSGFNTEDEVVRVLDAVRQFSAKPGAHISHGHKVQS